MQSSSENPNCDVAFVVVSCDKYSDLWGPFFSCMEKYWQDCPFEKYLVSNHLEITCEGVRNVKVGDDRSYSDNLRSALEHIIHEWVILWLDDVFVSDTVDSRGLLDIIQHAKLARAGFVKLAADMPMAYVADIGQKIGVLPKGIKYRSAIGCALYRKETLLKLLIPNCSAWELDRSNIAEELDEPFYALTPSASRSPPIKYVHLLIKGRWILNALHFLRNEGFIDLIKSRQTQSLSDYIYAKLYQARLFVFRTLRIYWR